MRVVKAALIASAQFAGINYDFLGDQLTVEHRFNNEQGYGRVQLDRVLPLQSWPGSVSGLIIHDGIVVSGTTTPREHQRPHRCGRPRRHGHGYLRSL